MVGGCPLGEAPVGLLREPNSYDFVEPDTIVEFPDSKVAALKAGGAILVPPAIFRWCQDQEKASHADVRSACKFLE